MVASSNFSLTGWKALAINNWQLAPLVHIQDGAPFTVTSGVDNSLTDTGNDRPNVINNDIYTHKQITQASKGGNRSWVNASAFAQNATGTFGNSGRFAYRGPGYFQLDSALSRTFPVHERLALVLRLEAFNALNHPAFAAPREQRQSGIKLVVGLLNVWPDNIHPHHLWGSRIPGCCQTYFLNHHFQEIG